MGIFSKTTSLSEQQIKQVSEMVLNRFKQESEGEVEEMTEMLMRKYQSKVAQKSWHVAQKWCKWKEGPVLFPDYTRMYYRKGNTEVVLQEYPPQIRLMKFLGSLRRNSTAEASPEDAQKVFNYSLALPYVVFLFRFVDGKFQDVYISFQDRPLKTLKEQPLRPFLSNLDSELRLCHGTSFNRAELQEGNLTQQIAYVLSLFWQTTYSEDWSAHFWNCKTHFQGNNDQRLTTFEAWQEASIDNPLFVIEDVKWMPHKEETYGNMIVKLFEPDSQDAHFKQEIYQEMSKEFLDELKASIKEHVGKAEKKVKDRLEEIVAEVFNGPKT